MAALKLTQALWRIYNRPEVPAAWTQGGNLPWNEPGFSARMLREHLDESHGAASRTTAERQMQIDWLWEKLALQPGQPVLDVTCGPGLYAVELAKRGCLLTGVDFSPAAIAHARDLALRAGVAERCTWHEADVRGFQPAADHYAAALLLYGQLGVFRKQEGAQLLQSIASALQLGARLCVELLDQERVDKTNSTWWYTDNSGLWGDAPFLHLGERFWNADQQLANERFQIIHLESGELTEVHLSDQSYAVAEMTSLLQTAGFAQVQVYPAWAGLPLYDAQEWVIYVAQK